MTLTERPGVLIGVDDLQHDRDGHEQEDGAHVTGPGSHGHNAVQLMMELDALEGLRQGRRSEVPSAGTGGSTTHTMQIVDCLDFLAIDEHAVFWIRFSRPQSRIIAVPCRTVGAEDRVVVTHICIDVWMIVRRRYADAAEFSHPDSDLRDRMVVSEFWIETCRHNHPETIERNRAPL